MLMGLEERLEQCMAQLPKAPAEELVRVLMSFYDEALRQLVGLAGPQVMDRLAEDPLVTSLLVLHDLHPLDLEERVRRALERVRPQLGSHGGDVALVAVDPAEVHLRLEGNCNGCAASEATLRQLIGRSLEEAAPEIESIRVDAQKPQPDSPYQSCHGLELELRVV